MRHQNKGRKLGREAGPRRALLRGLVTNFILHGKMKTTEAKAKEVQPLIEKYITIGKKNNVQVRRQLLAYLYQEEAVKILLDKIGPKYIDRNGGYTRIIKINNRQGDNAKMALIELV
jgi:large subunit ribosomal protein L17